MEVIDQQVLDRLTAIAQTTPRLRKNHNLHRADDAACHRLLNAVEPGSYIPPHRHLDSAKDETFLLIRGKLGVITFNEQGEPLEKALLSAGNLIAVNIPHGVFHTAVSMAYGTIFFEAKAGPYLPLLDKEKGIWAPPEGSEGAAEYLARLENLWRE